jgi:hypothetical protein
MLLLLLLLLVLLLLLLLSRLLKLLLLLLLLLLLVGWRPSIVDFQHDAACQTDLLFLACSCKARTALLAGCADQAVHAVGILSCTCKLVKCGTSPAVPALHAAFSSTATFITACASFCEKTSLCSR